MKPKTLSRILTALGVVLILYSQVMDVTVESGYGERIVNLHLLSRQQNYLWLGGIALLAGILLFALHRMKQSAEDERQEKASEDAAMREAVAKASAGASKSVAAFGSAVDTAVTVSSDVARQAADFELVSRIAVGLFVGVTVFFVSFGLAIAFKVPALLALVIALAVFLYSLKPGSASRIKFQLLAVNTVLLSVMLVLTVTFAMSDDPAIKSDGSSLWLIAAPLTVSIIGLYRVRNRAQRKLSSTASDND